MSRSPERPISHTKDYSTPYSYYYLWSRYCHATIERSTLIEWRLWTCRTETGIWRRILNVISVDVDLCLASSSDGRLYSLVPESGLMCWYIRPKRVSVCTWVRLRSLLKKDANSGFVDQGVRTPCIGIGINQHFVFNSAIRVMVWGHIYSRSH